MGVGASQDTEDRDEPSSDDDSGESTMVRNPRENKMTPHVSPDAVW